MQMTGTFNAQQFAPRQADDAHPPGKFQATISNTSIAATRDNTGGMFVIEFTTPAGSISSRYNLWNASPKAVEIAQGELSALCHATGVFNLDWANEGAALRNALCMIDVGPQTDKEGKPTGYMEVKKVFDTRGNEPGKNAPQGQPSNQVAAQQPAPNPAPIQQNNNGGWGNPNANPAPAANPAQPAWGAGAAGGAVNPPWGQR